MSNAKRFGSAATALALVAMLIATLGMGGVVAVDQPTDGDNLILDDGGTHPLEDEVSSDSSYEYRIKANGTTVTTYTANTSQNDAGNYDVTATLQDDDLIGNVAEGDDITIEVYDTTAGSSVDTATVTVEHIADTEYEVTDSEVQNKDVIALETVEPTLGIFGEAKDVGELEHEVVFSDADMQQDNRKAVISIEDSEIASAASSAAEGVSAGDDVPAKVYVNDEPQQVYADNAPEDAEGTVVVHDTDQNALIIEPNNDRQSLFVDAELNEDYGLYEEYQAFGIDAVVDGLFGGDDGGDTSEN